MTYEESKSHFSLWAMMAAPLILGNDLRHMTTETLDIITNAEVIAIDQDPLGRQGRRVLQGIDSDIYAKPLVGGAIAVALWNKVDYPVDITLNWSDLGTYGLRRLRGRSSCLIGGARGVRTRFRSGQDDGAARSVGTPRPGTPHPVVHGQGRGSHGRGRAQAQPRPRPTAPPPSPPLHLTIDDDDNDSDDDLKLMMSGGASPPRFHPPPRVQYRLPHIVTILHHPPSVGGNAKIIIIIRSPPQRASVLFRCTATAALSNLHLVVAEQRALGMETDWTDATEAKLVGTPTTSRKRRATEQQQPEDNGQGGTSGSGSSTGGSLEGQQPPPPERQVPPAAEEAEAAAAAPSAKRVRRELRRRNTLEYIPLNEQRRQLAAASLEGADSTEQFRPLDGTLPPPPTKPNQATNHQTRRRRRGESADPPPPNGARVHVAAAAVVGLRVSRVRDAAPDGLLPADDGVRLLAQQHARAAGRVRPLLPQEPLPR